MRHRPPLAPTLCLLLGAGLLNACASPDTQYAPPPSSPPATLEELLADYATLRGRSLTYSRGLGELLSSIEVRPVGPAEAAVDLLELREDEPQR